MFLQVPICSSDDISEQSVWLPFAPNYCEMVHWFKSWSVSCNDIHVPESFRRSGWKPALLGARIPSGLFSFLGFCQNLKYSDIMVLILKFPVSKNQVLLLLSALVAVPWMLFPKPYFLKKQHEEVCLKHQCFLYSLKYSSCTYNPSFLHWNSPSFFLTSYCHLLIPCFLRGTKVNPTRCFWAGRILLMMTRKTFTTQRIMRNLNSARSLYTNLYIP